MPDCIFCSIVEAKSPSHKLFEDENTFAFLDIFPGTRGHTLVIPKRHYQDFFDTPLEVHKQLMDTSKKVGVALQSALGFDGMNFFQNSGRFASQSVFHIHYHLFPRWENDQALGVWKPRKEEETTLKGLEKQILPFL